MKAVATGLVNGFREIWAHKVRSALSLIGVVMGVATLVAVFAIVKGMLAGWEAWIVASGGIEKVSIIAEDVDEDSAPIASMSPGLTVTDVPVIRAVPLVRAVSPEIGFNGVVSRRDKEEEAQVVACTPGYFEIEQVLLDRGRFISTVDQDRLTNVIVLGSKMAERIYPPGAPMGHEVMFRGHAFRVVGIMQEKFVSERARRHMDKKNLTCFIPLSTGMFLFGDNDTVSTINVKIVKDEDTASAVGQLERALLTAHRGIDDVEFLTNDERIAQFNEQVEQNTLAGALIGGLSLLVGGIGIMNIMLASVSERLREIGIRKAVGATDLDILIQILFEAVALTVVGGAVGCLASWGLVELLRSFMESNAPIISWEAMGIGFGFSVLTGLVFGIYPAIRAASLNPIEALRAE